MAGRLVEAEFVGDMFRRNVGLYPNNTMLEAEDRTVHRHLHESLKSNLV
jgi:hypothetical protein